MTDKYNTKYQEMIIDHIDSSYTNNVSARRNLVASRNFLIGANKVYQVYFNYGFISDIIDECNYNINCKLTENQFELLYTKYRALGSSEKLILERYPNNTCGYCRTSRATEIDHYLPQSIFRSYSIVFNNLVPSCHECNHKKGDAVPDSGDVFFFNPNFEKIDEGFYLDVEISEKYESIVFLIRNTKDNKFIQSLNFTFTNLGVYSEYSRQANTVLIGSLQLYHKLKQRKGTRKALQIFRDKQDENKTGYNELWRRSLYKFLLSNIDFQEQGYVEYLKMHNRPLQ